MWILMNKGGGPLGITQGIIPLLIIFLFFISNASPIGRMPFTLPIVGKPPMEDCYLAKARKDLSALLKMFIPEIVDINLPLEGVFPNCAVVSIKKSYQGRQEGDVCNLGHRPNDVYQDDHCCG